MTQNENNKKIFENLHAITATVIFEASALNRDEKLGGNIPSIKKITRFGNKTYGYLSRVAIRHYLFETLNKKAPEDWSPTPTLQSGSGNNKVVQFDLKQANIFTHAELDLFGYMFTEKQKEDSVTLTRKAPIGITKAIALEEWEGDMQFNANHDLASRCGSDPNPVNKEEQVSYFKVSFTLDLDKLGYDEWSIKEYDFREIERILTLKLPAELEINIKNVHYNKGKYEVDNAGLIQIDETYKKAKFILNEPLKQKRVFQILQAIKNGLIYHASGENYGIVPKFMITAGLKIPVPLFNSFVELGRFESSILDNDYIMKNVENKKLIYFYNPFNLVGAIDSSNFYTEWDEFLKDLGVKNEECDESSQS